MRATVVSSVFSPEPTEIADIHAPAADQAGDGSAHFGITQIELSLLELRFRPEQARLGLLHVGSRSVDFLLADRIGADGLLEPLQIGLGARELCFPRLDLRIGAIAARDIRSRLDHEQKS